MTESNGMLARLGNVFYWLCTGVVVLVGIFIFASLVFGKGDDRLWGVGGLVVFAIVVWLAGRAARDILAGR